MKTCTRCGASVADDNARFCPECGGECRTMTVQRPPAPQKPEEPDPVSLVGDKNLINESTIIGRQDKYEASNITIHNNISEDQSHKIVECAVSGKRIYMDHSVVCPECGRQVALEYYVERSKRCETCEQQATQAYRAFAGRILAAGVLDAARRQSLDAEAERLRIDPAVQIEMLRTLQRTPAARSTALSAVQQAELESAVARLTQSDDREAALPALETLRMLHETAANESVGYWYFLARAVLVPQEAVKSYEEELTDDYWQRFWGFLAFCNTGSPKSAAAVDRLHKTFAERADDIRLAETLYFLARGFDAFEQTMLTRAAELAAAVRREALSEPLKEVYDMLARLLKEGIRLDAGYTPAERFILLGIFRAEKYILQLCREQSERQLREEQERAAREQEARAAEERRRREREAAEKARRERQEALSAERSKRMAEEGARLSGGKPQAAPAAGKEFAGYDAALPARGGKWKKRLLIAAICLIVILIALFLIPAPESLQ